MGFFSKLKKFWKSEETSEQTAARPAEPTEDVAQAEAPAAAEAVDVSAAASPAAAQTEAAPEAEPTVPVTETPSAAAPVPQATAEAKSVTLETAVSGSETTPGRDAALAPPAPRTMEPAPALAAPGREASAASPAAPEAATAKSALAAAPAAAQPVSAAAQAAPGPEAAKPAPVAAEASPQPAPSVAAAAKAAPAAPAAAAPEAAQPGEAAPWRSALILELRQAEPRLSAWLDILLADVETAGPDLWERLRFLFASLEAPAAEADAFVAKFADWIAVMEYDEVELFRSELQYRLALALELEDEEDERNRLFLKLSEGLAKTKDQIVKRIDGLLGSHKVMDEAFWEELEEILLMADVGFEPAAKLMGSLREKVRKRGLTDPAAFKDVLREELAEIFETGKTIKAVNPPEVVMMIGVNGVGKTTTIAKLAYRDILRGKKVLIAAGDTFRAAAIEQLQIWAKRVGADFYSKGEGADPAAVAFEAMDKVLAGGYDVLYLDTAGRLHTKINLMEELRKIRRVVGKKHPGAPHRSVLVLDATTGQNALSQTKLFNEAAGVDEIILTKLDGTAKGGVVVGIALSFGVPITYVGLGEKMEDLRPFVGQDFAQALLGVD